MSVMQVHGTPGTLPTHMDEIIKTDERTRWCHYWKTLRIQKDVKCRRISSIALAALYWNDVHHSAEEILTNYILLLTADHKISYCPVSIIR